MDCAHWQHFPAQLGKWGAVFKRFREWVKRDVFKRIFDTLSRDSDMEIVMIDAAIVEVHRHGQGAKGGLKSGIGKSTGGLTAKILALTDALGNLVRFEILPGNRYDTIGVAPPIEGIEFDNLLADKAFGANWIFQEVNDCGAKICISQRPQRKFSLAIDLKKYKWRQLIENFFSKLKEFKRIAIGCEKTDTSFAAKMLKHFIATISCQAA